MQSNKKKNFRKRTFPEMTNPETGNLTIPTPAYQTTKKNAEVKFLQKQRERKFGIPALPASQSGSSLAKKLTDKNDAVAAAAGGGGATAGEGEKEELVLQDTFAQEIAVMVEDPNMLKYVEQELAKKRGKNLDLDGQVENELTRAEDELYKVPEHLSNDVVLLVMTFEHLLEWLVRLKGVTQKRALPNGLQELQKIQLPIEYKLKNIEETEAAKKLLQEKRLMGRTKTSDLNIPSSYSADYFQRGRDYAEKLRREHPELYKDGKTNGDGGAGGVPKPAADSSNPEAGGAAARREAATDQFMLERFQKRERNRVMRR
ncbi:unnamed protein product [Linum trigynum]|uniref:Uncharacterized protein n=1 Tax=Linum trigynum TaxID=586398 RepID=A0AAV2CB94_9ROSI